MGWWLEHRACNPPVLGSDPVNVIGDDGKSIQSQLLLCFDYNNPEEQGN